jgi:hypothetical protein
MGHLPGIDDLCIRVARSDIAESILPGGSHFKHSDFHDRPLSFARKASLRPDPNSRTHTCSTCSPDLIQAEKSL